MWEGSSIAATKARAVIWPTPGIVISRRQADEALVMRLMSGSIAATAVITAVRAAIRPRMAADRPAIPSLALRALSMKATVSERGSRTPTRPPNLASDFLGLPAGRPASCGLINERKACAGCDFTCTGLKKPVQAKCASPRASLRSVLRVASDLSA
jgi:hypothetical protein